MKNIQFRPAKGLLDFDGIDIKLDIKQQRENWAALFASMQFAVRFCSFNYVEAEKTVREFLDGGEGDMLDRMVSDWADHIGRLEALTAIMKSAAARVEISKDRALARTKRRSK
jgi:hypothetical protein